MTQRLRELSSGAAPLLLCEDGTPFAPSRWEALGGYRLTLTDAGRAVVEEGEDAVDLRGIDRYLGGTHIASPDGVWRWDGERRTITVGTVIKPVLLTPNCAMSGASTSPPCWRSGPERAGGT